MRAEIVNKAWPRFLLVTVLASAAFGFSASAASANYVNWSCTVQPASFCELTQAEPYYDTVVTNSDYSFTLAAGSKFIELSGYDYAAAYGNICNGCTGFSDVYLYALALPSGWRLYPLIYNDDPVHSRHIYATSVW